MSPEANFVKTVAVTTAVQGILVGSLWSVGKPCDDSMIQEATERVFPAFSIMGLDRTCIKF